MKWPSPPSTTQVPLGGGNLQQIIKFTHIFPAQSHPVGAHTFFFPKRHISHYNHFLHHQGHDPKRRFRNVKKQQINREFPGHPSVVASPQSSHTGLRTSATSRFGFRRRRTRYKFFNTNNLWVDLKALKAMIDGTHRFGGHRCFGGRGWLCFFSHLKNMEKN